MTSYTYRKHDLIARLPGIRVIKYDDEIGMTLKGKENNSTHQKRIIGLYVINNGNF